jgi:pectate lyase
VGVGPDVTLSGGIRIRPLSTSDPLVTNVIVRNIKLDAATSPQADSGDGFHIERAHHVWIDHCEVWDAYDGNMDITHGSNWITVSWTKFRYTDNPAAADHRFSNLIGHSENTGDTDRGRLKVTFHHNWWAERVEQRMPRIRFGQIHVFNNYLNATGNEAAIAAGTEASVVVENNYFDDVKDPHFFHEGSTTAQIVISGNEYVGVSLTTKRDEGQGPAFVPPYPYQLEPALGIPDAVRAGAGPK